MMVSLVYLCYSSNITTFLSILCIKKDIPTILYDRELFVLYRQYFIEIAVHSLHLVIKNENPI